MRSIIWINKNAGFVLAFSNFIIRLSEIKNRNLIFLPFTTLSAITKQERPDISGSRNRFDRFHEIPMIFTDDIDPDAAVENLYHIFPAFSAFGLDKMENRRYIW